MYKFTNGLIVYDKKTRDKFIESGYKLIEKKKHIVNEVKDGNEADNNIAIEEINTSSNTKTKPNKRTNR